MVARATIRIPCCDDDDHHPQPEAILPPPTAPTLFLPNQGICPLNFARHQCGSRGKAVLTLSSGRTPSLFLHGACGPACVGNDSESRTRPWHVSVCQKKIVP